MLKKQGCRKPFLKSTFPAPIYTPTYSCLKNLFARSGKAIVPLPESGHNHRITNIETHNNILIAQIQINITDDIDDGAVYGRNRQRHKPRGG